MDIDKIPSGRNPPEDINVIVEIPQGSESAKYELDKASGAIFVDRFLSTAMFYPGNYGFVPHTLCEDGDPLDVLIVGPMRVITGAVVRCRPLGVLIMEDEAGRDDKIVAVPRDAPHPFYTNLRSHEDLPALLREQIAHFFSHYKDLEQGKWVRIKGWAGEKQAADVILAAIKRVTASGPEAT